MRIEIHVIQVDRRAPATRLFTLILIAPDYAGFGLEKPENIWESLCHPDD